MSQQTAQQATRIKEEKSVATMEFPIAIEISNDSKKSCCDRVDRLKRKMFVATIKIMSRQIPKAERHEKLVANKFSVVTQGIPIAIRTKLLHKNSLAILSKSVVIESKKELREQVAKKYCML